MSFLTLARVTEFFGLSEWKRNKTAATKANKEMRHTVRARSAGKVAGLQLPFPGLSGSPQRGFYAQDRGYRYCRFCGCSHSNGESEKDPWPRAWVRTLMTGTKNVTRPGGKHRLTVGLLKYFFLLFGYFILASYTVFWANLSPFPPFSSLLTLHNVILS